MKPSCPRSLAVSLVWNPKIGIRRRWRLTLDPLPWAMSLLAVAATIFLAFTLGRLSVAKRPAEAAPSVAAQQKAEEPKAMRTHDQAYNGAVAPGQAFDESPDVITPLNVRDPSSLVMGPLVAAPPATNVPAATPPLPPGANIAAPEPTPKPKRAAWRSPQNYHF
jgi:hypothetical protein